ncbi:sigma-54-dependent Fis family transcriptional regulator [Lysobacter xinjiangensis]|uniref:Sigma-54-dependent Fis family transcriptional regulator n=1 Tax=Cognatilysobacter xinjiangensis TaxID=546892 RepID=A0ABQ3BVD9_9GAMM|nr:sigma-54 dependent transcriptional regulator [Lysobacter xinjiangensis]GGZ55847.1 sigma-54-dependent Fis family transcriptional regulator [Lysobacter xinjiangensis]
MADAQPSVLIIDDDATFASAAADFARAHGFQASIAHSLEESRRAMGRGMSDLTMLDVSLPDGTAFDLLEELDAHQHSRIALMTGEPSVENAARAVGLPVLDYLLKPLCPRQFESLLQAASARAMALAAGNRPDGIVGECDAVRRLASDIDRVAPTPISVLVTGESGTGKELVARAVHARSGRRGSFVAVNCGAIAPDLLASHLFGHERGSFTGAQQRHVGYFEQAHRGTLFLDEVTEMSTALQVYLLRVLETGEVTRVGGTEAIPVDVRIVAATNRDPVQAIEQGVLREDLYYRLADFIVALPPLRARGEDVILLAHVFVDRLNRDHGQDKRLSPDAERMLLRHGWPGNVRELRSVVQRAYLMSDGGLIRIPPLGRRALPLHQDDSSIVFHVGMSYADVEREMLLKTLAKVDGDKTEAARILGVSVRTIHNQLARLSVPGEPVTSHA